MVLINAAGSNDQETFKQALLSALSDFYNKEDDTNLSKLYDALASVLVTHDKEISALLNDNFLSVDVTDEMISRSSDKDRLTQEGAFQIDRIGFTPSTFVRTERHRIEESNTEVVLRYIPADPFSVRITSATDSGTPSSAVLDFDEITNTLTVAGVSNPGDYVFQYTDTGDLTDEREELLVPTELFEIGFNEGGFGNLGFGV